MASQSLTLLLSPSCVSSSSSSAMPRLDSNKMMALSSQPRPAHDDRPQGLTNAELCKRLREAMHANCRGLLHHVRQICWSHSHRAFSCTRGHPACRSVHIPNCRDTPVACDVGPLRVLQQLPPQPPGSTIQLVVFLNLQQTCQLCSINV